MRWAPKGRGVYTGISMRLLSAPIRVWRVSQLKEHSKWVLQVDSQIYHVDP